MIVIALLLLVAAAALVVFLVVTGTETVPLEWDELNLAWSPTALVVFLLGAVTLLLVVVALGLLRRGTKRKTEQRRELKRLRKVEEANAASRAEDRRGGAVPGDPRDRPAAPAPVSHGQPDSPAPESHPTTQQETTQQPAASPPTTPQRTSSPTPDHQTPDRQTPDRQTSDQAAQPAVYPGDTETRGSWHDEPGSRSSGRHEAG